MAVLVSAGAIISRLPLQSLLACSASSSCDLSAVPSPTAFVVKLFPSRSVFLSRLPSTPNPVPQIARRPPFVLQSPAGLMGRYLAYLVTQGSLFSSLAPAALHS